jgi:hypothetical protein
MPFVRDYPFGYKAWVRRDGDFLVSRLQYCGEGMTLDQDGQWVEIPSLAGYLLERRSLREELDRVRGQLQSAELPRSVWLIHQPPATLGMDICANGEQVGSPNVLQFVEEHQPLVVLSGHIHESPSQPGGRWAGMVGRTLWLQPGQMGVPLHFVTLDIDEEYHIHNV